MKKTAKQWAADTVYSKLRRLKGRAIYKKSPFPHSVLLREIAEYKLERLFDKSYQKIGELSCTAYVTEEPLPFDRRTEGAERTLRVGEQWAKNVFDCAWMHFSGQYDASLLQGRELVFLLNVGGEGLVVDCAGVEKQGVTCYASQFDYSLGLPHKRVVDSRGLVQDGKIEFWVDVAANDLFGNMKNKAIMSELSIAAVNKETRALYYDLQVLLSQYDFSMRCPQTAKSLIACETILFKGDITEERAKQYRAELAPYLAKKNSSDAFTYYAVGHAHLDLAWLWPLRESYRKGARTFATQIHNIEKYPDYIFGASQAQLYEWIKEKYPKLYERVKQLVKDGRWEVQGAGWVEPDSNLIGGESLVRQFFYGKRFFKQEFGLDMKIFWVPDSFGYSACIPQVMRLADVPYFLTQKLSWNTVNKFPYHTFNWHGLDGSVVLSHMLPENTYNSPATAYRSTFGVRNYSERKICNTAALLYGIGDGGAGPGFEHIERALRMADLKGLPKFNLSPILPFFKQLEKDKSKYPEHSGELYLERHRGTYTSHGKNKYYNRKCEFALRNYELLAAKALTSKEKIELPISKQELEKLWQEVLLYQFHDILPGSSINRVYDECIPRYVAILQRLETATQELASDLFSGDCMLNFNSFAYRGLQKIDGIWRQLEVSPCSYVQIDKTPIVTEYFAKSTLNTIENDKIKLVFDNGAIISLFDKTLNRELVGKEPMNIFASYTDRGDAWDIRPTNYYQRGKKLAECTAFSTGIDGACAYADCVFRIGSSTIKERISIVDGSQLVALDLNIDWHGACSMLRVQFPTSVATEECKFNVQFGHISRRTTENDSVEKAQFEVSGQKFVDMSQEQFGFSVLNDGKFGYRCKHGVIDVCLVRSPKGGPSKNIDKGENLIKLSLYSHQGKLSNETYAQAYALNNPLQRVSAVAPNSTFPMLVCDNQNIVLEAVKLSEDGTGIIARCYNCAETTQSAKIDMLGYLPKEYVGIMENKIDDFDGNLTLKPFQLVCLRYVLA